MYRDRRRYRSRTRASVDVAVGSEIIRSDRYKMCVQDRTYAQDHPCNQEGKGPRTQSDSWYVVEKQLSSSRRMLLQPSDMPKPVREESSPGQERINLMILDTSAS